MRTAPERTERNAGQPGRWSVLFGAWGVYAAFGLLVASTGALVPDIKADLGLSDSEMGLVLGAWQLSFIGSSIPAGRVIDRFGVRRALLASTSMMLVSALGRAVATDFFTLYLALVFFGIGAPVISVGAPKVAASLFEDRDRRTAVAIYSTAPGIGSALGLILPAVVIGPLVGDDWRLVMVVLTAVAGMSLINWAIVSRGLDGLMAPGAGPSLSQYRDIARLPIVRFTLTLAVISFIYVHGIGQWVVAILIEAGWTNGQAGSLAALGTVGGLIASFALPRAATPQRRPFLLVSTLLLGAASLGFLLSSTAAVAVPAVLVVMVARTSIVPLMIMTLMDHHDVGPHRIAAATGLFFTTAQIGGVVGPSVTGLLSDLSGGFRLPLAVHSAVMVTVAGAIAFGYRRATA